MTFKTICVQSATRLCSKQRKGFGLKPWNSFAYASLSIQPAFFPPWFRQLCFSNFPRERGYAPNENQVIVLRRLAKVPNNFLHLAVQQSTPLAENVSISDTTVYGITRAGRLARGTLSAAQVKTFTRASPLCSSFSLLCQCTLQQKRSDSAAWEKWKHTCDLLCWRSGSSASVQKDACWPRESHQRFPCKEAQRGCILVTVSQ